MVTHPITNRVRHGVSLLVENKLPLLCLCSVETFKICVLVQVLDVLALLWFDLLAITARSLDYIFIMLI